MYPATSNKFSTIRPPSPTTFVNFSPPSDYPSSTTTAKSNSSSVGTSSHHHHHQHNNLNYLNNSMSMKHSHTKNLNNNNNNNNKNFNKNIDSGMMLVNSATMNCSSGGIRNELMFHDDVDSIEFCMPDNNIIGHNNGSTIGGGYPGDSFTTERRRRGHSRRSNHKLEVEQQVKWTRKNIAATMERFEPTPSTSTNNIDYGTTTTQTIQQQQQHPINHVYSYAYYEPGAAKCHTNIPAHKDLILPATSTLQQHNGGGVVSQSTSVMSSPAGSSSSSTSIIQIAGPSKSPPRNSIRALLAKSFRSKALMNNQHYNHHHHQQQNHHLSHSPLTSEERHTYTTRYGTTENLYEEVNDQKIRKVLSDNRIVSTNVKEELRRVQHNHFRVLDELNLSLEALIMPPTPPDISPTVDEKISHASSMENLSSTLNSIELKDHTCINPEFDEGDLDSGFSGSGSSSGASYNESLRYYKTGSSNNGVGGIQTTTLPHNIRSCRSSTASGTSTSKSSMNSDDHGIGMSMMTAGANNNVGHCSGNGSPFNFIRRCSDTQRSISSGGGGSGGGGSNNGACGIIGGTKPKKHFWTIKQ